MAGPAPARSGYKARYVSGFQATVGTATLPQGSLYAVAATGFSLLEASWCTASSAAGKTVHLYRFTTLGTPGATQTAAKFDDDAPAAVCLPKATHTVAPTLGDKMYPFRLPTSVGTGMFFGFYLEPVEVAIGTANGVGFLPVTPSGTADVTFVWEE